MISDPELLGRGPAIFLSRLQASLMDRDEQVADYDAHFTGRLLVSGGVSAVTSVAGDLGGGCPSATASVLAKSLVAHTAADELVAVHANLAEVITSLDGVVCADDACSQIECIAISAEDLEVSCHALDGIGRMVVGMIAEAGAPHPVAELDEIRNAFSAATIDD